MTRMLTAQGRTINLCVIDSNMLSIADIAHSLSHINRFTGHALRPISVAEHSLMVCEILERHFQVRDATVLLAGLLLSAHEHLTGDLSSPMKQLIGHAWKTQEDRIQRIVLRHFGVFTAFTTHELWIHEADMHALSSEREQLLPDGDVWPCQVNYPALDWVQYGPASSFTPDDWRQAFMARFDELMFAIEQRRAEIDNAH